MTHWINIDSSLLPPPSCSQADSLLSILISDGFRLSDWIVDIYKHHKFMPIDKDHSVHRIKLSDLGFSTPTSLLEFYRRALDEGYYLLSPLAALWLRKLYVNQPLGEWLRIAVPLDLMIDSDGVPHLPKLGFALNKYYLETYWAYPQAVFHPHNEFAFGCRE